MNHDWRFRIIQDGFPVASGVAPDRRSMEREMSHYAMIYSQDGPISVETRTGKNKWRRHNP